MRVCGGVSTTGRTMRIPPPRPRERWVGVVSSVGRPIASRSERASWLVVPAVRLQGHPARGVPRARCAAKSHAAAASAASGVGEGGGDGDAERLDALLRGSAGARRRVLSCASAEECLECLIEELDAWAQREAGDDAQAPTPPPTPLTEGELTYLLTALVEGGSPHLATELFALASDTRGGNGAMPAIAGTPDASALRAALLLALVRSLYADEAARLLRSSYASAAPGSSGATFGAVVTCPTCGPTQALTVAKPHQGDETVACSSCRYAYALFTGTVTRCESRALSEDPVAPWLAFTKRKRRLGTHTMDVRAPDGRARTFTFATDTTWIPASQGDRVTVVSGAADESRVLQVRPSFPPFSPFSPLSLSLSLSLSPPPIATCARLRAVTDRIRFASACLAHSLP